MPFGRVVERMCVASANSANLAKRTIGGQLPRSGPLQPLLAGEPFEKLHIDIKGPHPRTRRGSVYILSCIDPFRAKAFPIPNNEAAAIARVVVEQVMCRFGCSITV